MRALRLRSGCHLEEYFECGGAAAHLGLAKRLLPPRRIMTSRLVVRTLHTDTTRIAHGAPMLGTRTLAQA